MSILDDFDKIVERQVQDEAYQQKLEMLKLIAKYPGALEGISQWFVRRWLVYENLELKSILCKPDQIYYGIIPLDLYGTYGNSNIDVDYDKRYFIAVLDGATGQTTHMFVTPKDYCEFIKLKTDYDNESTR